MSTSTPPPVSKLTGRSAKALDVRAGDWIEVAGVPGRPPRRGQVEEILGGPGHQHLRVRWDEEHKSLFFPSEGTTVVRHGRRGAGS